MMIRQGAEQDYGTAKLPPMMELFLILAVYRMIIYFGRQVTIIFFIFAFL
jgi:hypothetical protein